jgi:type IV secretion system protein VirB10
MRYIILFTLTLAGICYAEEQDSPEAAAPKETAVQQPAPIAVDSGTRIPLSMINSISTKNSVEGDRVYLETVFPITSHGRIVIPAGSFVNGTVTQMKRAGRIKGRSELYVRFDSLTLPNGVTRDFRARIGAMDGTAAGKLDRSEGKISGEGNKGGDARTIAETAGAGASVGAIAGGLSGHPGSGLGIGAAGGAAAGLVGVLLSRGPDAVLTKGTTVDMVLDRRLEFEESELQFAAASTARRSPPVAEAAPAKKENQNRRLWPLPF